MSDAKRELHSSIERELDAKSLLKIKESKLLMSGAIIGKNAEAREAQLREALGRQHLRRSWPERPGQRLSCLLIWLSWWWMS